MFPVEVAAEMNNTLGEFSLKKPKVTGKAHWELMYAELFFEIEYKSNA